MGWRRGRRFIGRERGRGRPGFGGARCWRQSRGPGVGKDDRLLGVVADKARVRHRLESQSRKRTSRPSPAPAPKRQHGKGPGKTRQGEQQNYTCVYTCTCTYSPCCTFKHVVPSAIAPIRNGIVWHIDV